MTRWDAIDTIANYTEELNRNTENIGARRLHTLLEKLLDEINFMGADVEPKHQVIDAAYVEERLSVLMKDEDLRQYIL